MQSDSPPRLDARAPTATVARTRARAPTPPTKRALRILLASYRSDPHVGGQGIYLRFLSRALHQAGHQVDVVSAAPYPDLDPEVRLIKLPSLNLYAEDNPMAFAPSLFLRPLDLLEWASHNSGGFPEPYTFGVRLLRYLKSHRGDYDILHDNQTLCSTLPKIERMGLPVLATIHHPITRDRAIDIKHARHWGLRLLKRRWYRFLKMQIKTARKLSHITVVSDSTQKDVGHAFGIAKSKMHRIYHGIDAELFRPMPEVPRARERLVATASADVPLKGLIYLIRAYHQLLKTRPRLTLVVIGRLREGQTSRELERLGIKDKVQFMSRLSPAAMRRQYARATLGCVPSVYEGFGFPAAEMLACGLPLVVTNGGSLPEIVGPGGVVVQHSNADALAGAIEDLLANPTKREELARQARPHVLQNFQWDIAAKQMTRLYRKSIAAGASVTGVSGKDANNPS